MKVIIKMDEAIMIICGWGYLVGFIRCFLFYVLQNILYHHCFASVIDNLFKINKIVYCDHISFLNSDLSYVK